MDSGGVAVIAAGDGAVRRCDEDQGRHVERGVDQSSGKTDEIADLVRLVARRQAGGGADRLGVLLLRARLGVD